jgi:SAM-dependent methyltransferase
VIAKFQLPFATSWSIPELSLFVSETTEQSSLIAAPENLYAVPRHVNDLNECFFYHAMDLPVYGSVPGYWDLRGHESEYLGNLDLAGRRVLEIGPASGHLSFFMDREGADVVSVEAAEDYAWEFCWDLPDQAPQTLPAQLSAHRDMMRRLRNSYWLAHAAFSSKAKVHYGSAYAVPNELGRFDVSVIGCVLLHNKQPLKILENCARLTNDTIVVVEVFRAEQPAQTPVQLAPSLAIDQAGLKQGWWHTWWSFSPVFFVDVLRSMGFSNSEVTFHRQICRGELTDLFTVVAHRNARPSTVDEAAIDFELMSVIDSVTAAPSQAMRIPITIVNRGDAPLSSESDQPFLLSYHWRHETGETVVWDGLRTLLPRTLRRDDREELVLNVRAPEQAGVYFLEITVLKEHVTWYDDLIPGLPLRIKATVQ